MVVTFGPKKINFKGRATAEFDLENCTGSLRGRGNADLRAARIGVKVGFSLHDDPAGTLVKIVSDAELGGVLADFAKAGGVAVANVIMADFARRCADEFAKDEVPEPALDALTADMPAAPAPVRQVPAPVPLAAHSLLWAVIKAQFVRLGQWLGLIQR
jgi:hypothetical protein